MCPRKVVKENQEGYPRSPFSAVTSTESIVQGKSRIREFFDLEADEITLTFYQKKEFFILPTSKNELKIILQTWHDLLVLLTVERSIAVEGIAIILEQFDNHYQVIQEMFASTADFGLTVLVILDNHLQKFFEMVSDMEDMTKASSRQRDFLWRQANEFLEGLENRRPPSVLIPQCLRRTPTASKKGGSSDPGPAKKKKSSAAEKVKKKLATVSNSEPQQAWLKPMESDTLTSSQWGRPTRPAGPKCRTLGLIGRTPCASDSKSRGLVRR